MSSPSSSSNTRGEQQAVPNDNNNNDNKEGQHQPPPPDEPETFQLNKQQQVPRIDSVKTIATTKWLALQTMQYTDRDGQARQWDLATRRTTEPPSSTSGISTTDKPDAVAIIPLLRHPDHPNVMETLLVEQYRPPVRRVTVEFPAGLVDAHETVVQAALRELREETGYVGEACRTPPVLSPITCMSPGLSDETIQVVLVEVDLSNPYNHGTPQPELDPGEHCVVKRVPLQDGLRQLLDQGTTAMPIMGLYLFALGYEMGAAAASNITSTLLPTTTKATISLNDEEEPNNKNNNNNNTTA